MKKAVIYARYSSDKQREESIEGQIRICKSFIEREKFTLVDEYVDRGKTGRNVKRPAFQKMLSDSKKGIFDLVIVYQFDRFSRDRRDSINSKAHLLNHGVKLLSATEANIKGPQSVIFDALSEAFAEYYSLDLSQKTQRGMNENIIKRMSIGGALFGYMPDKSTRKIIINDYQALVVKEIFERTAKGETRKEIVDSLNDRGIKNYLGKSFKVNSIQHMLYNKKYIGIYNYKGESLHDYYPRIIDDFTFNQVQNILVKNRGRRKNMDSKNVYYLTGKLYCGDCDKLMRGTQGTSKSGKTYRYYECGNKSCNHKKIRTDFIEEIVFKAVESSILTDKNIDYLVNRMIALFEKKDYKSEYSTLKKRYTSLIDSLDKFTTSFVNEDSPAVKNALRIKIEQLSKEKNDIEQKINATKLNERAYNKENLKLFFTSFKNEGAFTMSNIMNFFIDGIIDYSDRTEIIFSYEKENTQDLDFTTYPKVECSHNNHSGDPHITQYEHLFDDLYIYFRDASIRLVIKK